MADCVGIPAGMFVAARSHLAARRTAWWKPRVSLLLASYTGSYWWFESFDMLRKFVLASLVIQVAPGSRVQLWFGSVFASATALLYLKLSPYRSPTCHLVQVLVQLQVLFTYLAASLFFAEVGRAPERNLTTDLLLLLANCACFVLLAVLIGHNVRVAARADVHRLVIRASGEVVEPPVLGNGDEYHIFLSHSWQAQDQCRILKQRLLAMIPEIRVFLDLGASPLILPAFRSHTLLKSCSIAVVPFLTHNTDDLKDITLLEERVRRSQFVLVYATDQYFLSKNAMRELRAAYELGRPLIALLEPDGKLHGGLTREQVRAQLIASDCRWQDWGFSDSSPQLGVALDVALFGNEGECSSGADSIIEWCRVLAFQDITMRLLGARLLGIRSSEVAMRSELAGSMTIPPPRKGCKYHVYCSTHNAGAMQLLEELTSAGFRGLQVCKSGMSEELQSCESMLLYLNRSTWTTTDGSINTQLVGECLGAISKKVRIVLAHEMPSEDGGVPFEDVIQATPRSLLAAGLYNQIASPLKGGPWRQTSLRMVAGSLAGGNAGRRYGSGHGYWWMSSLSSRLRSWSLGRQRRFLRARIIEPPLASPTEDVSSALIVQHTTGVGV